MSKTSIKKIKENLNNGLALPLYDEEELEYVQKPIGETIYNDAISKTTNNRQKNTHWSDILVCKICGRTYKRSNITNHNKTKIHQVYASMNNKLKKILLP